MRRSAPRPLAAICNTGESGYGLHRRGGALRCPPVRRRSRPFLAIERGALRVVKASGRARKAMTVSLPPSRPLPAPPEMGRVEVVEAHWPVAAPPLAAKGRARRWSSEDDAARGEAGWPAQPAPKNGGPALVRVQHQPRTAIIRPPGGASPRSSACPPAGEPSAARAARRGVCAVHLVARAQAKRVGHAGTPWYPRPAK